MVAGNMDVIKLTTWRDAAYCRHKDTEEILWLDILNFKKDTGSTCVPCIVRNPSLAPWDVTHTKQYSRRDFVEDIDYLADAIRVVSGAHLVFSEEADGAVSWGVQVRELDGALVQFSEYPDDLVAILYMLRSVMYTKKERVRIYAPESRIFPYQYKPLLAALLRLAVRLDKDVRIYTKVDMR